MQRGQTSKISINIMAQSVYLFSYKQGSSILHKIPACWKIIFIPFINLLFFLLPPYCVMILIFLQFVIARLLKFSLREQLCDIKPIIYYAVLLLIFKIFSCLIAFFNDYEWGLSPLKSFLEEIKLWWGQIYGEIEKKGGQTSMFFQHFSWESEKNTIFLLLKLLSIMQSASLIYKTSTSLEIREGIGAIETFIHKIFHINKANIITDSISMFLIFIPIISEIWDKSKKSWLVRGGKNSIKMYIVLIPLLFSVGMKKAYNMARAVSIRK